MTTITINYSMKCPNCDAAWANVNSNVCAYCGTILPAGGLFSNSAQIFTTTSTGTLSIFSNPPPRYTVDGNGMRSCFVPKEGCEDMEDEDIEDEEPYTCASAVGHKTGHIADGHNNVAIGARTSYNCAYIPDGFYNHNSPPGFKVVKK